MSGQYQATSETGQPVTVLINNLPDECPQCHNKGTFSPLSNYYNNGGVDDKKLEIIYRCPNSKCREVFIGYYEQNGTSRFDLRRTEPKKYIAQKFSEIIKEISPGFSKIYNQALKAEHDTLDQICGPGYRKALEYIVKDYLIKNTTDEIVKEKIKSEMLGTVIANRIDNVNIKAVAKRAVWLGNDETHYVRKWEEKDLQDLKKLIELTLHWMEAESLTSQLLKDMPDA